MTYQISHAVLLLCTVSYCISCTIPVVDQISIMEKVKQFFARISMMVRCYVLPWIPIHLNVKFVDFQYVLLIFFILFSHFVDPFFNVHYLSSLQVLGTGFSSLHKVKQNSSSLVRSLYKNHLHSAHSEFL